MQNIRVVYLYEDCLFLKIQEYKSQLRNPNSLGDWAWKSFRISYYYGGQAETTVFSAHNSQQIEESHHREGRREWVDGHVCELSLYSAISALFAQEREVSF